MARERMVLVAAMVAVLGGGFLIDGGLPGLGLALMVIGVIVLITVVVLIVLGAWRRPR